jgi:hypothetical protein
MNLWDELGFRENPYSTDPVPPNGDGVQLLVGRDSELSRLRRSLTSSVNHSTIEGSNGVGKTSLVGIAAFMLFEEYRADPENKPMFIPVQHPFQISGSETPEAFSDRFMITLAREIIARRDVINKHHSGLRNLPDLDRWLNDPIMHSAGGGGTILGVGGNFSATKAVNSSQGFARGGVEVHLREMLSAIFPRKGYGGFVCVLDNLELLDTSARARSTLEALRDGVFAFPGVRWVLCGARGIVRSVVSTPRLQGKLSNPMELNPLNADHVNAVVQRRLELFKTRHDAYTPVDVDGFRKIYEIGNQNLRIALKYCEDFVLWCVDSGNYPISIEDKLGLLDVWFAQVADDALHDTSDVGVRAWEVFDGISERREGMSPGDYEVLGFNSSQALQPHLRSLEQATLIESSTDDTDKRRKTITLTPRGWIVRYHRKGYRV